MRSSSCCASTGAAASGCSRLGAVRHVPRRLAGAADAANTGATAFCAAPSPCRSRGRETRPVRCTRFRVDA
jgi:hypothetical protein